ncbi:MULTISPECIES: hypothetical protein [Bradyrhizobium]|uniref:Uncharacterized protein n=1 Tax=Bradyrhizobium diazoefficiens TaxID=1355477 RepID=A0A809XHR9_9BRAD|nr:hypothetical protein [Bradyrhizobium diazoefficiens]MBP1059974.1 hypothetical protein [Bradyrhizobium japonicum]AWO88414.2 hypothetical protein DI395_07430 [Bradyrhizobium diazoefficiens]WLB37790.1 hypothetical protein QIH78_41710 [Bradyrhizobium diazoefficiens]BCE27586.1 hypothetical protein XF2B_13550 [Bradyrhizobium diazoefficiens]BCF14665.1 hypothetical protein XF13B_13560 [Bradyrhizobium diazoefficiens]
MPEKWTKPPSLAQLFEAPDGFVGRFGWMCGYSADATFLNDVAERFSRQVDRQRAFAGRVALALMLDPGNPQIASADAPGVLHLPIKTGSKPFKLLHAKIALLGFASEADREQWRLRLIVSTGNWTRQTLEESLDLAWTIEISSEQFGPRLDAGVKQRCADIKAAWNLLAWLRGCFDCRALDAALGAKQEGGRQFEDWIAAVTERNTLPAARFFDSREQSLLAQLPKLIRATTSDVARNCVAMGSGYYETPADEAAVPSVLADIVEQLQRKNLLTRAPNIDIFVDPIACQAVAPSFNAIRKRGWHVRKAGRPEDLFGRAERTLHAKFLFGANFRDDSNVCNSAWIYLGSGNLTKPGFSQKMSEFGGNLEAGVVFEPEDKLLWSVERRTDHHRVVSRFLPVQWDEEFDETDSNLSAGSDMPVREDEYVAAPVAYFAWEPVAGASGGGWLKADGAEANAFEVVDSSGLVCGTEGEQGIWWPHTQPAQVQLRWEIDGRQRVATVPVLDQFGRLAGSTLSALGIEEAWQHLASFPLPPDEEDLAQPGGDERQSDKATPGPPHRDTEAASYPIRRMMQLIEDIAVKQTSIDPSDWTAWCVRLEQSLSGMSNCAVVARFRTFAINPLSPLRNCEFRPHFAETASSVAGAQYEGILKRIESAWGVEHLGPLEA